MTTIVTRAGKGSALTNTEVDTNFTNLNSFKVEQTAATGAAVIPPGTTAQRPGSPVAGYLRFNSDTPGFEGWNGTAWGSIGGGAEGVVTPDADTVPMRDSNADLFANNFVSNSDVKLKQGINPIQGALTSVKALHGVTFTWKNNPNAGEQVGFIAQELEQVFPNLVFVASEDQDNDGNITIYKGVNYPALVAVLVEAIKELEARVNQIEVK